MPEEDYLREHVRLIKLLDASKNRKMQSEAKRQRREVVEYLRSKMKQ